MRRIRSLLGIVPAGQPRSRQELALRNYLVLSAWLDAELRALVAREATDLLGEIDRDDSDLVACHDGTQAGGLALLERVTRPLLLIPTGQRLARDPISSLIVAVSGERRANEALEWMLRISGQTGTPVDLVHVAHEGERCACEESALETMGDQLHHEYPRLVEKIVAEGSPYSTPEERTQVRRFLHSSGEVTREVLKLSRRERGSAIALEWKGSLAAGRAETLRRLLREAHRPVFVVRVESGSRSRLKLGGVA